MDKNLKDYSFSETLELFQSCYCYGTDEINPRFVCSPCFYTKAWFEQTGFTLLPYKFNSYICVGITDVELIRNQLRGYYFATNNKCAPFL